MFDIIARFLLTACGLEEIIPKLHLVRHVVGSLDQAKVITANQGSFVKEASDFWILFTQT